MKRHGLRNPWPRLQFPNAFLKHRDGIGAFFNPDEGEEYMLSFNRLRSAFRKQDASLTDDEAEAVREMIESETISPAFVQRMCCNFAVEQKIRVDNWEFSLSPGTDRE